MAFLVRAGVEHVGGSRPDRAVGPPELLRSSATGLLWLALSYDRLRGDERDPVKGSLDAIVRATHAVEDALLATDAGDHVRTAHGHLLAACEWFAAYLQVATPW